MECIKASIALHSCGANGSFEHGVSKIRSLFFGDGDSVGEGVGDGAADALGLGCGEGDGSEVGVTEGEGDGEGVLFGAAALELSFFTNTPLLHTNFPDFLMQVYW